MRLILVRHGHTNDLKNNIVQGHRPIPLNVLGRKQAQRVARALRTVRLTKIYSSDSRRAVQTAMAIAEYHQVTPIEFSSELREKSSGVYEGQSRFELSPYILKRTFHPRWRPRKGESHADVFNRTKRWYRRFSEHHHRGTILIVSHGGFLRSLLTFLFHGPRLQLRSEYWHDNTGLTVIEFKSGKPKLVLLNDTRHLQRSEKTPLRIAKRVPTSYEPLGKLSQ